MDLHDVILILAGFAGGFGACLLLRVWVEMRIKPYADGWKQSDDAARAYQLREAYRAGMDQAKAEQRRVIEAPAPYEGWNC